MKLLKYTVVTGTILVCFAVSPVATAQNIVIQPVSVTATSTDTGNGYSETSLINGSGLSDASIVQSNDPVPASWPTHGPSNNTTAWRGASGQLTPILTFDLGVGVPVEIGGLHYWNYTELFNTTYFTERGVQDVNIFSSLDGLIWTQVDSTFTLVEGPESTLDPGANLSFSSSVLASHIQFEILSNYGDPGFVGMNEVRFIQVPEPSSFALAGLGAAGLIALRRRR